MALATIPEAIQSQLHVDEPAEETVTVVILRGDESVEVEVLRKVELRHVQKCLCNAFHERFLLMCASLTDTEGQTFDDFITDKAFKGPWGIPDNADGKTDVEAAAHGFVTFKSGQVLSLRNSWAEMIEREVVSVVFQGSRAGGRVERLFGSDGLDDTAIDTCELYTQKEGKSVNQKIETEPCEDMGRIASAANFVETIEGTAAPLNTPQEALKLMQIIDALYQSAETGAPVAL